jgi:hypothetical protein
VSGDSFGICVGLGHTTHCHTLHPAPPSYFTARETEADRGRLLPGIFRSKARAGVVRACSRIAFQSQREALSPCGPLSQNPSLSAVAPKSLYSPRRPATGLGGPHGRSCVDGTPRKARPTAGSPGGRKSQPQASDQQRWDKLWGTGDILIFPLPPALLTCQPCQLVCKDLI